MNSYDFVIYEFICFMNSYTKDMNSGVPRFQMVGATGPMGFEETLIARLQGQRNPGRGGRPWMSSTSWPWTGQLALLPWIGQQEVLTEEAARLLD